MVMTELAVAAHHSTIAWGDVPTWVSAGVAVLALAAAVVAAFYVRGQGSAMREQLSVMRDQLTVQQEQAVRDRDVFAQQRKELAEAERLRARLQAEKIHFFPDKHFAALADGTQDTFPVVTVVNESSRPIRDLRCKAAPLGDAPPSNALDEYIGRLEPDNLGGLYLNHDRALRPLVGVLRAGEQISFLLRMPPESCPNVRYWLQFEDDTDLLWELDSDLRLKRIDQRWAS